MTQAGSSVYKLRRKSGTSLINRRLSFKAALPGTLFCILLVSSFVISVASKTNGSDSVPALKFYRTHNTVFYLLIVAL